jgi:hypothetical protein
MTAAERWHADRYKNHGRYSAEQVRAILIEDGIARRDIPLTWLIQGCTYIAQKTGTTREVVFVEIDEAVKAGSPLGLGLPRAGVNG